MCDSMGAGLEEARRKYKKQDVPRVELREYLNKSKSQRDEQTDQIGVNLKEVSDATGGLFCRLILNYFTVGTW